MNAPAAAVGHVEVRLVDLSDGSQAWNVIVTTDGGRLTIGAESHHGALEIADAIEDFGAWFEIDGES